jgi:hypothetical protein
MANTFSFVGYLRPIKNTDSFKSFEVRNFDSGWMNERLVFNVIAGDNRHRVEINAGRWKQEDKNTIYSFTKGGEGKKGEAVQIPWAKRNDPATIETIAGWRVFTVDLDTFQHRRELEENGEDEALEASNKKRKHFLAGTDFCEYVNKVVNSEKTSEMKFRVNGNITYRYSEKHDRYYSTYEVTKIYRVDDGAEVSSEVDIDFYFGADTMDSEGYEETGFAVVSGYTPYYDNTAKKNLFCPIALAMRFGTDEEGLKKIKGYHKIFGACEGEEVRRVVLACKSIDGAQRVDVTYDDLPDGVKENVDAGIITLEDAIRDNGGTMMGERIQEIRIDKLGRGFSGGSQETAYMIDDMVKKSFEEEEDYDLFDEDDDL